MCDVLAWFPVQVHLPDPAMMNVFRTFFFCQRSKAFLKAVLGGKKLKYENLFGRKNDFPRGYFWYSLYISLSISILQSSTLFHCHSPFFTLSSYIFLSLCVIISLYSSHAISLILQYICIIYPSFFFVNLTICLTCYPNPTIFVIHILSIALSFSLSVSISLSISQVLSLTLLSYLTSWCHPNAY